MRVRLGIDRYNLTVQMVLISVLLVLLTAVAAGLPAVWLIRTQVQQQAWDQVAQGTQATQALYRTWQDKVADFATLTAQRPTLQTLLQADDTVVLRDYLQMLLHDTDLTMIQVCDGAQRPLAAVGPPPPMAAWCDAPAAAHFRQMDEQLWLVAGKPVEGAAGTVVVAVWLDDAFAAQLQAQTGLSHTLLEDGRALAGAFADDVGMPDVGAGQTTMERNGRSYYVAPVPLDENGLVDAVALDVTAIADTQQDLLWALAGGIGLVAVVGSVLGVFLARRIGRPLRRLADAAAAIRAGDWDTSLVVPSSVQDVTLVSQALEQARVAQRNTLTEMQEAKAWSDHLLDAIVEGIVTLDRRGHITFFSSGAERIFGVTAAAATGRSCDDVFKPADTDEPFSHFIPAPDRQRKIVMALADGRQATVSVTGARLTPPKADDAGVALVFRDVSDAEMVNRLMGQFMANITHEFRTPLSALAASAELLLDRAPDLTAAELSELLTSLHLGIVSLQTLVDNLLESASLEAGRFRIYARPTDLGEIIGEATRMMQPLLEKYGQWLEVELPGVPPTVEADPRRVVQVLVNLLSNAVKYSPDETAVTIQVSVQDELVRIAVADRGAGVPAGFRPNLFRRFVSAQNSGSKSQVGAGLGLFVAKAIVEAHGGHVGVADRPGGGSLFWFTLPRATAVGPDVSLR